MQVIIFSKTKQRSWIIALADLFRPTQTLKIKSKASNLIKKAVVSKEPSKIALPSMKNKKSKQKEAPTTGV